MYSKFKNELSGTRLYYLSLTLYGCSCIPAIIHHKLYDLIIQPSIGWKIFYFIIMPVISHTDKFECPFEWHPYTWLSALLLLMSLLSVIASAINSKPPLSLRRSFITAAIYIVAFVASFIFQPC